MNSDRIYLDNAATSWPKPPGVYEIVDRYLRELGAPAGRGVYREANEVERLVADARRRVAAFIGAEEPQRIIFTSNGTDSLNLALHGLLQAGDHVVTTVVEHNSVLRPLRYLQDHRGVEVTRVACDGNGFVDPDAIRAAIQSNTKLISLIHVSNVTGVIQPAEEVGRIAAEHDVLFLLDAAQSLGHVPVDVKRLQTHLLAAPGHKGLLGPLGSGLLYVAPGIEGQLQSIRQGGTGTSSDNDSQPNSLPDKYESGNHNVPAILGLGEGLRYLEEQGGELYEHQRGLAGRLIDGLRSIPQVELHGPADVARQAGVVSITLPSYDPQEVATMLDGAYSVQVRAGIHCAPRVHAAIGTAQRGGTIRFSVGAFNTEQQIDAAIEATRQVAASAMEG